ncbi:unnamed protein product [Pleuronectes platessa]|uniref:Uncharacterized protein n=1 Tax=Pleuronectes platessa TaxID=8262 RepID=A0A9N7UVM0_PLEPL|nr:unnamed protein product [Pleuronectes platessa]
MFLALPDEEDDGRDALIQVDYVANWATVETSGCKICCRLLTSYLPKYLPGGDINPVVTGPGFMWNNLQEPGNTLKNLGQNFIVRSVGSSSSEFRIGMDGRKFLRILGFFCLWITAQAQMKIPPET